MYTDILIKEQMLTIEFQENDNKMFKVKAFDKTVPSCMARVWLWLLFKCYNFI